jgi:hypothetical protein
VPERALKPALAVLAATALAGCGSSGSDAGGSPAADQAAQAARQAFGVFRRPARARDAIPRDEASGGVKSPLSRLVYSGTLGTLYAYVHSGSICLSYATRVSTVGAGSASGTCAPAAQAAYSGVSAAVAASSIDRLNRVALLLPDGVRTVRLTRIGAPPETLRATDNALVSAAVGLHTWTYATRAGARVVGALPLAAGRPPGHP